MFLKSSRAAGFIHIGNRIKYALRQLNEDENHPAFLL